MLGTSNAWSTSHLSWRSSKPAYYIVDCGIFILSCSPDVTTNFGFTKFHEVLNKLQKDVYWFICCCCFVITIWVLKQFVKMCKNKVSVFVRILWINLKILNSKLFDRKTKLKKVLKQVYIIISYSVHFLISRQ